MERNSLLMVILLFLGVVCVIIAGLSPGQDIAPEWVGILQYFLIILGVILITAAIIFRQIMNSKSKR
ncbi:MAG: hypothetical protein JW779_05005 [Candidatus Thorarchaeota archaeon]|nr:hypothetical protein [Candidatus Thorarchaeota archaeon]